MTGWRCAPVISATCPHCKFRGCIYNGERLVCPKCGGTHEQEWTPRKHPLFGSARQARSSGRIERIRPPLRTASRSQTTFSCPKCARRIPPWALVCPNCGRVVDDR